MKHILSILVFQLFSLSAFSATITATSLLPTDVQTALKLAKAGDTVVLPAGTIAWTNGVSWTAPPNVTLKGAGTTNTGGGDKTVIIDDIASGTPLLAISAAGGFRMTGITFKSGTGAIKDGGTIQIYGGPVRLDHLHFVMTSSANYKALLTGSFGVLDHSILDFTGLNAIYIYNGRGEQGNLEWSLPTDFGGTNFFYIEDNIINGTVGSGAYSTRVLDGFTAAKAVVRFNTIVSACLYETHATGHSSDDRGTRAIEAYGNLVTSPLTFDPNFTMADVSSGCALIWGNSADQVYKGMFTFNVTRKDNVTYKQGATPSGLGYAGTTFNGTGSMWDGGTALGTDTMLGYPAIDQPGRGQGDLLTGSFPTKINSTTGTIYWPHQALEPIYIWNNTGSFVNGWGRGYYNNSSGGRVLANRDYYPQASGIQTSSASPFDGTSGTGWGTLANRPNTCTPGVAYFATDQGSWNTSSSNPYGVQQNGADGVLYKCMATNVWTLYYTPLTYPHPLQSYGVSSNPPLPPPRELYIKSP